jgi:hypothetical protein
LDASGETFLFGYNADSMYYVDNNNLIKLVCQSRFLLDSSRKGFWARSAGWAVLERGRTPRERNRGQMGHMAAAVLRLVFLCLPPDCYSSLTKGEEGGDLSLYIIIVEGKEK